MGNPTDIGLITVADVRRWLNYEPHTGKFIWRVGPRRGRVAGSLDGRGYWRIPIEGRDYKAHRLVWLLMTGEWPEADIDHVNQNRADNRWHNLRPANRAQNLWNASGHCDNPVGVKGVSYDVHRQKWSARICINGHKQFLGRFDTLAAAHAAYLNKARAVHGEFFAPPPGS